MVSTLADVLSSTGAQKETRKRFLKFSTCLTVSQDDCFSGGQVLQLPVQPVDTFGTPETDPARLS